MRKPKKDLLLEKHGEDTVCTIPISAHFTVDNDGRMTANYEYSEIKVKYLADFLMRGFGLDIE